MTSSLQPPSKKSKNLLARMFDRLQRRFRTARPGSVLILVVALLVLMALIGTAYIATARSDRYTAVQHTKNTQIDMLVESVLNMVVPVIQDDMYDQTPGLAKFRPPDPGGNLPTGYEHYDSQAFVTPVDISQVNQASMLRWPNDTWLASRECRTQEVNNWPQMDPYEIYNGITVIPIWDAVSYPPIRNGGTAVGTGNLPPAPTAPWHFESPEYPGDPSAGTAVPPLYLSLPFYPPPNTPFAANDRPPSYAARPWMEPHFKEFPKNSGTIYPSFIPHWWQKPPAQGNPQPVFNSTNEIIAADADGDGIPDSGLWLIPDARIDGITYYGAIRVVDNNSAVNVNTAWTNRDFNADTDLGGTGLAMTIPNYPRYFTPSSIGLNEMLQTYQPAPPNNVSAQGEEMRRLDAYRFNGTTPTQLTDQAGQRYSYPRLSEFLYWQLGARLDNPGNVANNVKFQTFSAGDQGALGFHGQLINPDATPSNLESIFFNAGSQFNPTTDTLFRAVWNFGTRQSIYPSNKANGIDKWMSGDNSRNVTGTWNFASEAIGQPLQPVPNRTVLQKRGLMVTSNPVGNGAPIHEIQLPDARTPGAENPTLYAANAGIQPFSPAGGTSYSPQRVSINQAPFLDLWRAYWNVMAELTVLPTAGTPIVYGSPFDLRVYYATQADFGVQPRRVRPSPAGPGQNVLDPPTYNSPYVGRTFEDYYEVNFPTTVNGTNVTRADSFKPNSHIDTTGFVNSPFDRTQPVDQPFARPGGPFTAGTPYTDYHPARMFANTMRSIPDLDAAEPLNNTADTLRPEFKGYSRNTPRMNADQVSLLRSAIAAVNAEALRDSDADVNAERVVLKVSRGIAGNNVDNNQLVPVNVVVYGMERQPFITEVYADTDTAYAPAANQSNPYGYVAVELYNPYDQDIPLYNWKLVALDRRSQSTSTLVLPPYLDTTITHGAQTFAPPSGQGSTYNIPMDESTLIADFDPNPRLHLQVGQYPQDVALSPLAPSQYGQNGTAADRFYGAAGPLIVPAKGYLILENYYDPTAYGPIMGTVAAPPGVARHRPAATGLLATGDLTGPGFNFNRGNSPSAANGGVNNRAPLPQVNIASVPGLSGMVDPQWRTADWPATNPRRSVFNRELVLLRPRRADGNYSVGSYHEIKTLTEGTYPPLAYDERPNTAAGDATVTPPLPIVAGGEVAYSHLRDLVPVDSIDFTGLMLPRVGSLTDDPDEPLGRPAASAAIPPPPAATTAVAWHYSRQTVDQNSDTNVPESTSWTFVYPGRYDANPGLVLATAAAVNPGLNDQRPRQQGVEHTAFPAAAAVDNNPWLAGIGQIQNATTGYPTTPITLGIQRNPTPTDTIPVGAAGSNENAFSSFPSSFRIPLGVTNVDITPAPDTLPRTSSIGPNPLPAGVPASGNMTGVNALRQQKFPFGGFARNGDMLAVPFIGAYRISYFTSPYTAPNGQGWPAYGAEFTVAELNAVTMDASFAEDADTQDDPISSRPLPIVTTTEDDADSAALRGSRGTAERETIGRFCPLHVFRVSNTNPGAPQAELPDYVLENNPANGRPPYNKPNLIPDPAGAALPWIGIQVNDYGYDPSYQPAAPPAVPLQLGINWEPFWRCRWASDLFDYLCIWSPSDDYDPNYPTQREFEPQNTKNPPAGQQWPGWNNPGPAPWYYPGDLISYFRAAGDGGHELWRFNPQNRQPRQLPNDQEPIAANGWELLRRALPLQNGSAPAAFHSGTQDQQHTEDDVPIQGLININTAGWRVLATLPLVVNPNPNPGPAVQPGVPDDSLVPGYGAGPWGNSQPTYRQLNAELAKAIVYWRDVDANPDPNIFAPHGPFKSIYELQQVVDLRPTVVAAPLTIPNSPTMNYPRGTTGMAGTQYPYTLPGFMNGYGTTPLPNTTAFEADDPQGDLVPDNMGAAGPLPAAQQTDNVRGDYKERYLNLTRISNLITTRSDSFTVYILVQGWQNAGSRDYTNFPPKAVIEKRAAYIIDRSHAMQRSPTVTKIPFNNN